MLHKNDNLDDLFKNAANDYPLKTNNSNWESVAAKLQNSTVSSTTVAKKRNALKYAALLLLLLGGTILFIKLEYSPNHTSKTETTNNIVSKEGQPHVQSNPGKNNLSSMQPAGVQAANSGNAENNILPLNKSIPSHQKYSLAAPENNEVNANNSSIENNNLNSNSISSKNLPDNSSGKYNNSGIQDNVPITNSQLNNNSNSYSLKDLNNNSGIVTNNQNTIQEAANAQTSSTSKAANEIHLNRVNKRLYGTLYGAPVFSLVKFQKSSKPGYKIGIALGYRINNNLSVELGLERDHINYYTDGKYFDKSSLHVKETASLQSVNATSKLTSVPVSLKYSFLYKKKSNLFATAGANIVELTHTENYEYLISKNNGSENDASRSFGSVTDPKYFTTINLSAGYETKIFKQYNISISPYYQLPIREMGIGNLQVTNFGVKIGIVRDLK